MTTSEETPRLSVDWNKVRVFMALRNIKTETELRDMTGLTADTFLDLKRNARSFTSRTVERLAVALGCNPLDLMKTEGFPATHLAAPAVPVLA